MQEEVSDPIQSKFHSIEACTSEDAVGQCGRSCSRYTSSQTLDRLGFFKDMTEVV